MARGSNMFPFIWDPPLPFCRYPVGCARIPPFCSSSWYLAQHDVFFFCLNHDNFASYIFLFLWDNIHNMPWGANVPDPSAAFVLHALYAPLNSLVLTAVFHCFFLNTCNLKNKNYEKNNYWKMGNVLVFPGRELGHLDKWMVSSFQQIAFSPAGSFPGFKDTQLFWLRFHSKMHVSILHNLANQMGCFLIPLKKKLWANTHNLSNNEKKSGFSQCLWATWSSHFLLSCLLPLYPWRKVIMVVWWLWNPLKISNQLKIQSVSAAASLKACWFSSPGVWSLHALLVSVCGISMYSSYLQLRLNTCTFGWLATHTNCP